MQLIRETIFLLLAFLDLEFTKRKIAELGIEIEMNPAIRWLVNKLGLSWGAGFGVLIPTFGLATVGWYLPNFLSFMLGVRTLLFLLQLKTRSV